MDQLPLANEVFSIEWLMALASLAVGVVFAFAAASKLTNVRGLVIGIRAYRLVPGAFAPVAASLLIVGEGLIALAHIAGAALYLAIPAAIALLSLFLFTIASILRSGEVRPCLCFGAGRDDRVNVSSLVRVALLLVTELFLLVYLARYGSWTFGAEPVFGYVLPVVIAASAAMLAGWCLSLSGLHRAWRVVGS